MSDILAIAQQDWVLRTAWTTAALVALVLVLRRPVARHFGPGLAYALWFLPIARLLLPPVVLPAWLAPSATDQAATATDTAAEVIILPADSALAAESSFDWLALAQTAWLAGAVTFVLWRIAGYVAMRRSLMRDAVLVERRGRVRVVESPLAVGPVAFGVIDPVVALPSGFLASSDPAVREFALAHELAHHRGHDLAVNLLFQGLLALHWFNPLAWMGWRAMRRDQEAACDARAMAGRPSSDRAAYARVIADFAIGPRLALAAPMACPVLGDRSIIHRLRSLTMSPKSKSRMLSGWFALCGAIALALPITATITYADDATTPSPADQASPDGTRVEKKVIVLKETKDGKGKAEHVRSLSKNGTTVVIRSNKPVTDSDLEKAFAELPDVPLPPSVAARPPVAPVAPAAPGAPTAPAAPPAPEAPHIEKRVVMIGPHGPGRLPGRRDFLMMSGECQDAIAEAASRGVSEGKEHRTVVKICAREQARASREARAEALEAVRDARADVADDDGIPAEVKASVLRQLDAQIAQLKKREG